jgi:hypothetical protein
MLEEQFSTWVQNCQTQKTERRKNPIFRREVESIIYRFPVTIFRTDKNGKLKKVRKILP